MFINIRKTNFFFIVNTTSEITGELFKGRKTVQNTYIIYYFNFYLKFNPIPFFVIY